MLEQSSFDKEVNKTKHKCPDISVASAWNMRQLFPRAALAGWRNKPNMHTPALGCQTTSTFLLWSLLQIFCSFGVAEHCGIIFGQQTRILLKYEKIHLEQVSILITGKVRLSNFSKKFRRWARVYWYDTFLTYYFPRAILCITWSKVKPMEVKPMEEILLYFNSL